MSPTKMIATLYMWAIEVLNTSMMWAYILYPLQNNFSQKYVAQFCLAKRIGFFYCSYMSIVTNIAYIYLLHKYES